MSAIVEAVLTCAEDGQVSCVDAHAIANRLGVTPEEVGVAVNEATELRFYRCQLGVFGYGPKAEGKSKVVLAAAWAPPEIEAALAAHTRNKAISCRDVWAVAVQFHYPRLAVANIVERLGLKVRPCQLSCF